MIIFHGKLANPKIAVLWLRVKRRHFRSIMIVSCQRQGNLFIPNRYETMIKPLVWFSGLDLHFTPDWMAGKPRVYNETKAWLFQPENQELFVSSVILCNLSWPLLKLYFSRSRNKIAKGCYPIKGHDLVPSREGSGDRKSTTSSKTKPQTSWMGLATELYFFRHFCWTTYFYDYHKCPCGASIQWFGYLCKMSLFKKLFLLLSRKWWHYPLI